MGGVVRELQQCGWRAKSRIGVNYTVDKGGSHHFMSHSSVRLNSGSKPNNKDNVVFTYTCRAS